MIRETIRDMIREMTADEAEAVAAVWAASPGAAPWPAGDVLQLANSGTKIWVSREEGNIAGAVAVRVAGDEAEVLNLGVAPSYRRKGIGRSLLNAAIAEAGSAGAARVFLEVRESNAGARAFYASLGFSQTGRRRAYYSNPPEDALVLSRLVHP